MRPNLNPSLLNRARRLIYQIEDGILVVMLLGMIGMAAAQIFLRNALGSSIVWGDVLVRILVLWIGLWGAMIASRDGKHINIDLITRYLPERAKSGSACVVNLFTAVICGMMAWFGSKFVHMEIEHGGNAFESIPVWICESIIPIAFAVISLRYVILTVVHFKQIIKPAP
jgi:TRAP-type C4-dicarboxylate transport system permease small subunit